MKFIRDAVAESGRYVRLTYSTGETVVVDFATITQEGGVFAPLASPAFFKQVTVGERGRYIEWPGGLDFCADALWLEGKRSVEKPKRRPSLRPRSTA